MNLIVYLILFGVLIFVLMFFYQQGLSKKSLEKYTIKSSIQTVISSVLIVLKSRDTWIISVVGAITFGTFLTLNMLCA